MNNKHNFYFNSINIEKFGRLKNVNIDKTDKFNFIYSVAGFGKSTFLTAIETMALPVSKCRIYNHFKEKYGNEAFSKFEDFFVRSGSVELNWNAGDIDFTDRLLGYFDEAEEFCGYGNYQFSNDLLNIKKYDCFEVAFRSDSPPFPECESFSGCSCELYDCYDAKNKKHSFSKSDNPYAKDCLIDFIAMLENDIKDVDFVGGEAFLITKDGQIIPAESFGDLICGAVMLYGFLSSCSADVILIDNFDCMLNSVISEAYIKMFLGTVSKMKNKSAQFFITVSDICTLKIFFDTMYRNLKLDELTFTPLDRIAERLISENKLCSKFVYDEKTGKYGELNEDITD